MIDKTLKPCPFCGNPPEVFIQPKEENPQWFKNGEFWKIQCSNEYCEIRPFSKNNVDRLGAVCAWQGRVRRNKITYSEDYEWYK